MPGDRIGGTTQRAEKPSDVVLDRKVTMRFDANVSKDMPWTFEPVQRTMAVKVGETALAFYKATNTSDHAVKGTAMFNVSPDVAGVHFNKIECFCFKEQTLAAGETVEMPVSFYVDPALVKDRDAAHLKEITLSYTFYPVTAMSDPPGLTPDRRLSYCRRTGAREVENKAPASDPGNRVEGGAGTRRGRRRKNRWPLQDTSTTTIIS